MTICEACRQKLDPASPDAVRAVEVRHEQDFGGEPLESIEGRTVYFHTDHVPQGSSAYRLLS